MGVKIVNCNHNIELSAAPQLITRIDNRKGYVTYGEDDNFPYFLASLLKTSGIHNAIIKSKLNYAFSAGLSVNGDIRCNRFGETFNDVYEKLLYDKIVYGGFACEVIWSRDNSRIAEVYHIDFEKIRCTEKNSYGAVDEFVYSNDFRNRNSNKVRIPAFDKTDPQGRQLIYAVDYIPGTEYYPVPGYCGGINWILTDGEISNYHLSAIRNGMSPSMMINFSTTIPTEEERKKIKKQIKDELTGSDAAGKFIVTFSDDSSRAPSVTTLTPSQIDKQLIQLSDTCLQNILVSHQVVSPMLVGIKTSGQLGGNNELENAFQIFSTTIIRPLQDSVIRILNDIFAINKLDIAEPTTSTPINFTFSENTLSQILTTNELRAMIGYDGIEEEEEEPSPIGYLKEKYNEE